MADTTIRAAGVVVLKGPRSNPKVLLVHRPRHRDWSLPKGKLDAGEHVIAAAVRECDEETGIVPLLSQPVGQQNYRILGRRKTVDYWLARVGRDNKFAPDDEVDEIMWVSPDRARELLTYGRDAELMDCALAAPRTWPLILLRHTAAEKRSDYKGRDYRRPLTGRGRTQAKMLTPILAAFGIQTVVSSTSTRCMDTVKPYAASIGVTVMGQPRFSEEAAGRKPKAVAAAVEELAAQKQAIVVCSHRPVLPLMVGPFAQAVSKSDTKLLTEPLSPGGFIVLHRTIRKGLWEIEAVERHNP